jgi:hypothetical protein
MIMIAYAFLQHRRLAQANGLGAAGFRRHGMTAWDQ